MSSRPQSKLEIQQLESATTCQISQRLVSSLAPSAAHRFAQALRADLEKTYLTSFIKQLGMELLSWNYPRLFSSQISDARAAKISIDDSIRGMFGFSAEQLGVSVLRQFPLGKDIIIFNSNLGPSLQQSDAFAIPQISSLGELFARAQAPSTVKEGVKDWEHATQRLSRSLPSELWLELLSDLEKLKSSLTTSNEATFLKTPTKQEEKRKEKPADSPFNRTEKTALQKALMKVYQNLTPGGSAQTAIEVLGDEVLPAAGFAKGCVYLLDGQLLIPIITLCDNSFKPIDADRCSGRETAIVLSIQSKALITRAPSTNQESAGGMFCQALGNPCRGVLFLELMPSSTPELPETKKNFLSVKECVDDLLAFALET